MTKNEVKAIQWIKSVRDNAVITLDHIEKNDPNVSPILYAGRKEKAETIIKGFEQLEQYRLIGTVEECREAMEKQKVKKYERGLDKDVRCPICATFTTDIYEHRYCTYCGQRLE